MLYRFMLVVGLMSFIFLLGLMNMLTPSEAGPLGVLVFFTLTYLIFLGITVSLCRLFFVLKNKTKFKEVKLSRKKEYYYGSILAFGPVILLVMRSFGSIDWLELILVILFMLVGCFYVSKRT